MLLWEPVQAADQLDLVGDEVVHVPVGLCLAGAEHKVPDGSFPAGALGGQGSGALVVNGPEGQAAAVDGGGGVDLHAVHHPVDAAVEDDALHIGQSRQLGGGDVVGMNFGIDAHGADLTGKAGVFFTAQVQNQNHVLLHRILLQIFGDIILPCGTPGAQ